MRKEGLSVTFRSFLRVGTAVTLLEVRILIAFLVLEGSMFFLFFEAGINFHHGAGRITAEAHSTLNPDPLTPKSMSPF